jgi:hypothetical protein
MDDKAKVQRTIGMSSATCGTERVTVRDLLRRKIMQKELQRRGHRAAETITLFRRQA